MILESLEPQECGSRGLFPSIGDVPRILLKISNPDTIKLGVSYTAYYGLVSI